MPPKKSNPRSQYFNAIRDGNIKSLRWCLSHGGISLRAEDNDGHTGVQLAAAWLLFTARLSATSVRT